MDDNLFLLFSTIISLLRSMLGPRPLTGKKAVVGPPVLPPTVGIRRAWASMTTGTDGAGRLIGQAFAFFAGRLSLYPHPAAEEQGDAEDGDN